MGSTIPGVGQTPTSTLKSTKNATIDHETFLRLFLEQLKNQDPTAPVDPTQSLAQLASFSQLEQGMATNQKLDSLLNAQMLSLDALLSAQSLVQANSLIGRTVTSGDGEISGKVVSVKITKEGALATLADGRTLNVDVGVTVS